MEIIQVGEIMIPLDKYPHVSCNHTLRQAMEIIENATLNIDGRQSLPRSVLVFNEDYQLIGRIRRRDILRGLETEFLARKPLEYRKKIFNVKIDPSLRGSPMMK